MYNHKLIEKKWMQKWQQEKVYAFKDDYNKPKFYVLDMFPYPSGSGLHVGHVKGYTATDILSRYKRLNGFNVLHPIGWDAFGLPAEQYALDTKNHPKQFTLENIDRFRSQLLLLGFDYDYAKEVNTTDENFYKWTQWIFIQLYKNNLAEIKEIDVNWCEALGTVLANEEVLKAKDGSLVSERGNHPVIKKPMKQWVLKITAYADQLLQGLDEVDWPQSLKDIQRKWIGKTNGYEIEFKGANFDGAIKIFTTKPYTIFGTTNLVIAPESNYINLYIQNKSLALINYINLSKNKNSFERQKKASLKTGIKTDLTVFHPFTNELIDVYVSDYVLANYGTGAIMAVPSLDERDFAFAQAFNLKTKIILQDNKLINSDFLNGLSIEQANLKISDHLKIKKIGQAKTTYKIKDWIFSRQRYWGEPFPVLYDEDGNIIIDENLPCVLPYTKHIEVAKDGTSPLSNLKHWVYVEIDHKLYRRDTNTMPQWAGSSWYYIAYILKNNDGSYLDLNSKAAYEKMQRWLPVDIYIGGQEHAVLHLLYSRFWHRFLYDIKVVPTKEPFQFIYNQGMVLDKNNQKMSKSKNNVVNPLDVIEQYGADTLRLYEMFMGPLNASLPWNSAAVGAMHKWLNKIYRLFMTKTIINQENNNGELEVKYHQFIKNVTNNIEKLNFNTAISEMMIFINECYKAEVINQQYLKAFVIVLSCFAPYISEELYQKYFCNNLDKNFLSVNFEKWPTYNEALIIKQMINLPIQINGKFKKVITIAKDSEQDLVIQLIKQDHQLSKIIDVDKAKKIIFLKNKIINLIF